MRAFTNCVRKIVLLTLASVAGLLLPHSSLSYAEEYPLQGPGERWRARTEYERTHVPTPFQYRRKDWEIIPETYWFFYEEPSIDVETKGVLQGIRFTRNLSLDPVLACIEGSFGGGHTDYDGSLSDGTPHTETDTDYIFELRGLVGPDIFFGETVLTPFLGLGYRFWHNNGESQFAYERRIQYLYSPIGLKTNSLLGKKWSWGTVVEFDLFWRGWVKSYLSDVNPNFNDPSNRQERGFGARGSVYLRRSVNEKTSVSIEPFIRYWNIDDSDTTPTTFAGTLIGGGYEPANKTIESGLQISILF